MSKRALLPCLLALCLGAAAAQPPLAPENFRHRAEVAGAFQTGTLCQVPLPAEFLRASAAGLADVRLYGPDGREVPYVIIPHRLPPDAVPSCALKLVAYDQAGAVAQLTVQVPDGCPSVAELTLDVSDRDFKKQVTVEGGDDRKTWQPLAEDVIYDFTSQVDLRRTTLQFPATAARYLRLTLRDAPPEDEAASLTLSLRSEGLDLSYSRFRGKKLSIQGLRAVAAPDAGQRTVHDRQIFTGLVPATGERGTTVIVLTAGLPADFMLFDVSNPAYCRTVAVSGSGSGREDSYSWLKSDRIHAFPGAERDETQNRLELSAGVTPFYKIVIENGDNPPLDVRSVTLEWVRRDLYFVAPSAGPGYALYTGQPKAVRPSYDTGEFVNAGNWFKRKASPAALGPVRTNDRYEPVPTEPDRARVERIGLIIVVITLMVVLGWWIVRLVRKGASGAPPA
jgi:hypothetical protein